MTCKEFFDFIGDYLEGELPLAERSRFQVHLDACTSCVNYLDGYRTTIELGKEAVDCDPGEAPPDDVPPDLIEAILKARRKE